MILYALLNDETGILVSTELMLVVTLAFTAVAVGLAAARDALTHELHDVSEMIGTVSQSYNVTGIQKAKDSGEPHGSCSGFGFNDRADNCDCIGLEVVEVCGKVQYGSSTTESSTSL